MNEVLLIVVQVSALVFVVSSMLAMGLSLTVPQIVQPLKNGRLVVVAVLLNFVVAPLVVWLIQVVLDLDEDVYTALVLLAIAAGAPFLPKLAESAKGNVAFSVGLMVMLMVVTVVFMPIALPLLISGTSVDPWDIASSLVFLMLLPLGIGLVVKARYSDMANGLQPHMAQTSTIAIVLLLVGGIILQWDGIVSLIGTRGVLAIVILLGALSVLGYLAGGSDKGTSSVLALGTAQRNVSAALVVAVQNFSDRPDVVTTVMVAAIVGLVLLVPTAGELGRRMETA